MKKLRLIVTYDCQKNCEGCCNKGAKLPSVISFQEVIESDYDEIYLTGGEPLLDAKKIEYMLKALSVTGKKVFIYSAYFTFVWSNVFKYLEGITFTIHEKEDISDFGMLDILIKAHRMTELSLRLNVFDHFDIGMKVPDYWTVKRLHWIKNCPLPEGEELRRLEGVTYKG